MDLNYLFYRQQIERSMAEAASSEAARKVHAELARGYEQKIDRAITARKPDGDARPSFHWGVQTTDLVNATKVNPTMAVAMTAREVGPASQ